MFSRKGHLQALCPRAECANLSSRRPERKLNAPSPSRYQPSMPLHEPMPLADQEKEKHKTKMIKTSGKLVNKRDL